MKQINASELKVGDFICEREDTIDYLVEVIEVDFSENLVSVNRGIIGHQPKYYFNQKIFISDKKHDHIY